MEPRGANIKKIMKHFAWFQWNIFHLELTIYSEEGIADMDLPDNLLMMEDLEYLDNITSCNKVENCLMLSEYEQNLIKETESPNSHRRSRKWSIFKQPTLQVIHGNIHK